FVGEFLSHSLGASGIGCIHVNQINVGTVVELSPAEFAHADHGKSGFHHPTLGVAVHRDSISPSQVSLDDFVCNLDKNRGEIGEGGGGVRHIVQAQQIAHADAQHLPSTEPPEGFQLELDRRQVGQSPAQRSVQGRARRSSCQDLFLYQPIDEQ